MAKHTIRLTTWAAMILLASLSTALADTWRLGANQEWTTVSAEGSDKFLLAVAEAKKLVNTGQTDAAQKAFEQLKRDYPQLTGPDFDAFIEAELLFGRGEFAGALRGYEKLLNDYPESKFRDAALDRLFAIGTAYLGGQKKQVLGILWIEGYAEGVKIMEKVTERAGMDSAIGFRAARAVAESYEQRREFYDAYLKWWEISSQWQTGQAGKDTLLGMARNTRAVYNKPEETKRPAYDGSKLSTSKTYYEKFQLLHPQDANEIGIARTIGEIDEQMAFKQLSIARYYQRIGKMQAANLYYDMVIADWPKSKAAAAAERLRAQNPAGWKEDK